jgi:putative ATP-binding cassette transporter
MIQLVPALIVAPMFMRGAAEFGEIPQASMAFAHLVGAFSLVVNQFGQLSSYAAVLARLSALGEAVDTAPPPGLRVVDASDGGRRLVFERVTLRAPHDGHALVRELSLDLVPGARAFVAGSADATAALGWAIAGIWPSGEGRIVRPGDVMFLPERPYLPPGTLRQLLVAASTPDDADIRAAVRATGADAAVRRVGGLDVERTWDTELSLLEQRLLEIGRMLLAAPSFAILTHLEMNLSPTTASAIRAALSARGIGWLELDADVPEAARFDEVVRIRADGSWTRTGPRTAATG